MRIIAGRARGRTLRSPRRAPTRPTADRTKEALFSIVESLLAWGRADAEIGSPELWSGVRVLDAYAGTGALGVEALSRGAASALFLELDREAVATIKQNLAIADASDRGLVQRRDARQGIAALSDPIDLVFLDPPYEDPHGLEVAVLAAGSAVLAEDAIIAFEHHRRLAAPNKLDNLQRQRERRHGETVLTVYARGRYDRQGARERTEDT